MSIDFRCPEGHKLSVANELAGRKARCPVCRVKMYVPLDNTNPKQIALTAPDAAGSGEEALPQPKLAGDLIVQPDGRGHDALQDEAAASAAARVYRPDRGKVQTVQLLAATLAAVALFNAAPALVKHANLATAPDWARIVLFISALQLVYVAWMASIPDWSTVWMGMLVFALVSTMYAVAMAVVMYTPLNSPLGLGLSDVRHSAAGWCFAVLALNGMMTYVCGRVAGKWRRAYEAARLRMAALST